MAFDCRESPLTGLRVLERAPHADARGQFRRLFCPTELAPFGWATEVVQVNYSMTQSVGSVRGIHFQYPPYAEDKLVACVTGAVWDVAVDLRAGSPTFLRWHAEVLSAENGRSLLIPKGFGHGFQTLEPGSALVYVHSAAYEPGAEGGIHPHDPRVGIEWPRAVAGLSDKDASRPGLDASFRGITL
ncbi:MAG TPA: dTDP-4-dehydrorhamnose 3,5-epimerase [Ramlibacter sp.]|nr:dTDP-4-dehydrorhamnose 3,5-epimerase [Ramlibacter sp.]